MDRRFPTEPIEMARRLEEKGHPTFLVGGAVRDALLGREASDVDLATRAHPHEVERVFRRTFEEGSMRAHGTMGVLGASGEPYEVTTFRRAVATDGRRATVEFADRIEEDLARRDFTVNAMAWRPTTGELVDPFGGKADLSAQRVRAVGNPDERFREDRLRILRGYRFVGTLGFALEPETGDAMARQANAIGEVSAERVASELLKLLEKAPVGEGRIVAAFQQMENGGLLGELLPELARCRGVSQPPEHHAHDVLDHMLWAADVAEGDRPDVRLGMLLHDVGKPDAKKERGGRITFHGHDELGAGIAREVLERLNIRGKGRKKVVELVAHHMRLHQIDEMGDRALRRLARNLGALSLEDLVEVRYWDKAASGRSSLEALSEKRGDMLARVEDALKDVELGPRGHKLAVNGHTLMETLGVGEGRLIGRVLRDLQCVVDEDPSRNRPEELLRVAEAIVRGEEQTKPHAVQDERESDRGTCSKSTPTPEPSPQQRRGMTR